MGEQDTAEPRFSADEYATLLNWWMVSYPWQSTASDKQKVEEMLNKEARARDYDDWEEAIHELFG